MDGPDKFNDYQAEIPGPPIINIEAIEADASKPVSRRRPTKLERMLHVSLACCMFPLLMLATTVLLFLMLTFVWKGNIDIVAHASVVVTLLLVTLVPCHLSCVGRCGIRSCLWRYVFIGAPLIALVAFIGFFLGLFYSTEEVLLNTSYDASQAVLVVGTGPSGLSAAWMLAKSGRKVVLLEATDDIGGHSKTWVEPTEQGDFPVDIGYIFNNEPFYFARHCPWCATVPCRDGCPDSFTGDEQGISRENLPLMMPDKEEDLRFFVHFDRILMRYAHPWFREDANSPRGWFMIEPSYSCPHEELVGTYGDGVKWLCNPRLLSVRAKEAGRVCVVYSFGSHGESQFEQDMSRISSCEIHTFDPGIVNTSATWHRTAIGPIDSEQGEIHLDARPIKANIIRVPMKRLSTIMKELNHDVADVMKIDTEGAEFTIIKDMAASSSIEKVGQMQIEVHWWDESDQQQVWDMFDTLNSHGMVVFHKEINILYPKGAEYALMHLMPRPDLLRPVPHASHASHQAGQEGQADVLDFLPSDTDGFFAEYAKIHKKERAACGRILVFDCNLKDDCGDLADRFVGMMTFVLVSMLTQRAFIVRQDFFDESFQPTDPDVDWRWSEMLERCTRESPLFSFFRERNAYGNVEDLLGNHSIVRIRSNRGYLHGFLDHPKYGEKLAKLGFDKCTLFGRLFDQLFTPTEALTALVQKFISWDGPLGQQPVLTVGFHMTLGDRSFDPQEALGQLSHGVKVAFERKLHCAKNVASAAAALWGRSPMSPPARYFLITDHEGLKQHVRVNYTQQHVLVTDDAQHTERRNTLLQTYAEWYAHSLSNLFLYSDSGFSRTALMRALGSRSSLFAKYAVVRAEHPLCSPLGRDACVNYHHYINFTNYFGYPRVDTALNTSGAFNGRYWDNVHAERGVFGEDLEAEVDRFLELVQQPDDTLRYLTPLGAFLWWHGFSDDFYSLCLSSILSVLFVTKMGATRQCAQCTLNYFRTEGGFSHLRYERPMVQNNPKGSQFMWRDIIADANSTGLLEIQLNSKVERLERVDDMWAAVLADGRRLAKFQDVILAIPASESGRIVPNPWHKFVLNQIDYITTFLTLHTDAEATVAKSHFAPAAGSPVLYFVDDDAMTGKIGQIFGDQDSDLLLTVHGDRNLINSTKVKTQYAWSHHFFSLWEIAIARKFVPMFNSKNGVHLAGDWIYGVGHNDAIRSGIAAACTAGLSKELPNSDPAGQLYSNFISQLGQQVGLLGPLWGLGA
ncbi:mettl24 [Symbiodinium microadriaticum]|nr:mettl24 [Symbiodinium microadriaticum]